MEDLQNEFRASLECYNGPLDLLLYLIKKDEVDIFDIPIARVLQQYQLYLEILRQVDPNACGDFLVLAAQLMEIKSKLLLPREKLEDDEELEDPRVELVRQLLEYKKFKERAMLLERRLEDHRRRYERPPLVLEAVDPSDLGPVSLGKVTVWDLFTAFHKIQLALGAREPHRVIVKDRPITEYIGAIESHLSRQDRRRARFEDLFTEARSRYEAIGFLLAILEMAKESRLELWQEENFGTIEVRLLDEAERKERLHRAAQEAASAGIDPAEAALAEGEGSWARTEGEREEEPKEPS